MPPNADPNPSDTSVMIGFAVVIALYAAFCLFLSWRRRVRARKERRAARRYLRSVPMKEQQQLWQVVNRDRTKLTARQQQTLQSILDSQK